MIYTETPPPFKTGGDDDTRFPKVFQAIEHMTPGLLDELYQHLISEREELMELRETVG